MSLWGMTINQSSQPLPICLYLKDITQFNLVELWQPDFLRTQIHTGRPHISRLRENMYSETRNAGKPNVQGCFLIVMKYCNIIFFGFFRWGRWTDQFYFLTRSTKSASGRFLYHSLSHMHSDLSASYSRQLNMSFFGRNLKWCVATVHPKHLCVCVCPLSAIVAQRCKMQDGVVGS